MPFIFESMRISIAGTLPTDVGRRFLLARPTPFIRHLTIEDLCSDQRVGEIKLRDQVWGTRHWTRLEYAQNPFLCGVLGGPSLRRILENMPALRSISVLTRRRVVHGLSWATVKEILSFPQIKEVSIIGLLLCPSKLPDDDYCLDSLSHVTSFHYEVFSNRFTNMGTRQNYPFPSEEEALLLVLSRIHTSLEKLVLSSEPAPLLDMSNWNWPNLRELRLRGERRSDPPVPYITLLSAMPNLRTLLLELTLVSDECTHAAPLWPLGSPGLMPFPCPDLSRLSVTHPHPADELYRHLPSSLRALSLCCRPHKSEEAWISRRLIYTVHVYEFPVLTSAEMLGVLRNCQLPRLTRLEIEYEADGEEFDLLGSLAVMFPRLVWLQIHRYRRVASADGDDGDVRPVDPHDDELGYIDTICEALSNLPELRTFCAYLDLPRQPGIRRGGPLYYDSAEIEEYTGILRRAVSALAGTIPSLEVVYLWCPRETGEIEWAPFEVVRAHGATKGDVQIRGPLDARKYGGPVYPVISKSPLYGVDP